MIMLLISSSLPRLPPRTHANNTKLCAMIQFGSPHFGTNWGCIVFAPAIGSITFSSIFGQMFEERTADGCRNCEGTQCYRKAFVVTTLCLAVGLVLNVALVSRTKAVATSVAPSKGASLNSNRKTEMIFSHVNKMYQF